jgi:CPA2 family monovalent cation:H+ antiporter-2
MAACLLVVLGSAVAVGVAGLSMALGALIAGMLLAETEYRRQIEVTIEPFKGLLVGVFLVSIGMSIDLARILQQPLAILGAAIGLVAAKAAIVAMVGRAFRAGGTASTQAGLLLGPGSEFSFVILAAGLAAGVLDQTTADFALIVAALTMAALPALERLGVRLERRAAAVAPDPALMLPGDLEDAPRVIIAGYGRVGQLVADMLDVHAIAWLATDTDVEVVARARRAGRQVFLGDASQPAYLDRCGLENARALVVTMDRPAAVEAVVDAARVRRADLTIVARARDAQGAARLCARGATDAVPETIEASLLLAETLLVDVGVPMGHVIASIHDKRALLRDEIQARSGAAIEVQRPRRRRRLDGPGASVS